MSIGVFSVDPGGATGTAWGIFNPAVPVPEQLRERTHAGSDTVSGAERVQIQAIAELWRTFYALCVDEVGLPADDVWLVVENYIYTGGNTYAGDSASISTALIWGLEGYRMGVRDEWRRTHKRGSARIPGMILQNAGDAKGFATGKRLKEWDVWVVGKEHERSAWQHIAFFLKRYQIQHNS